MFEDNMMHWIRNRKPYVLPFFTIWGVWNARNSFIFWEIIPNVVQVSIKVATSFLDFYRVIPLATSRFAPFPLVDINWPIGLFDGAE